MLLIFQYDAQELTQIALHALLNFVCIGNGVAVPLAAPVRKFPSHIFELVPAHGFFGAHVGFLPTLHRVPQISGRRTPERVRRPLEMSDSDFAKYAYVEFTGASAFSMVGSGDFGPCITA